MFHRGRRLRRTPALRALMREIYLRPEDLIMPYFVEETTDAGLMRPIPSMPGQFRVSLDNLECMLEADVKAGLRACLLFGIPAAKDQSGSGAWAENGIVQQAVRRLKQAFPDLVVITDVCLCEYTSHGHCGLLSESGEVRNDPTLELLAKTALSHVAAGADLVAPSDMMDGRVGAIRKTLDAAGYTEIAIMSYAVKYAGAFYGPFRDAADSAPQFGDRKAYQMDPTRRREAFMEAAADLAEGADILMVKPAGPYLDILHHVREHTHLPLAAYQVSGEYSMIKAAGQNGWIDEAAVALESLIAIKRAGADLILTYFAQDLLRRGVIR